MKKYFFFISLIIAILSCNDIPAKKDIMVSSSAELNNAIENAEPGSEIILANGVWKDIEIKFTGKGTEEKPIILRAETQGKVFIEGKSDLKFSGEYLVVSGLYFRNGYTPSSTIIEFRMEDSTVANHCRVTNCVIENFNQPHRDRSDHWVEFWGRFNQLDHCYISGKSNQGPTIMVSLKGNENIRTYHQINNNHFGPRPRLGGPHAETLQIGDSNTSMAPGYLMVANNLFENCDGEVEIISNKSTFNEFRNNVFYKSEGSLVMRHGNYCTIDGNFFIGDNNSEYYGGIRVINTGHWLTNNYFINLKGQNFRSPLAIMNGIPKSPMNRYNQVTDVVIAYNTWINCKSPWQIGVGTNISEKDVLPPSEIRSARPVRTLITNNIIYNEAGDENPIIAYDKMDGIECKNNIINNNAVEFKNLDGLEISSLQMKKVSEYIYIPVDENISREIYQGFDFENIDKDILGNERSVSNSIGAISNYESKDPGILNKKNYGANWFSNEKGETGYNTLIVTSAQNELSKALSEANEGDIIELKAGEYEITSSLVVNTKITIQSADVNNKARIIYSGAPNTPAFEMHPFGDLSLKDIVLSGQEEQYAFASLSENMNFMYNLRVENTEISNFRFVLKAYKESFADNIYFSKSYLKNCENGLELSEETDDFGFYNVEYLTIDSCIFENVKSNVIDYYRGGYDESTIGGILSITNSRFTNCGNKEKNGILLNTRGIINVDISNNTFKNNQVKLVALLWGAKNNTHSDNVFINSGKLMVEENLELKLVY
ncbi:MAG: hypothetical protein K9H49_19120 [Bacteroidales bacterium]|nr:hypothetical protein [Bacteroidales bacterium]MCF8390699.1 hypothetical protein [Bacteroidales bacterium]